MEIKNISKKLISLLLATSFTFVLTGSKNDKNESKNNNNTYSILSLENNDNNLKIDNINDLEKASRQEYINLEEIDISIPGYKEIFNENTFGFIKKSKNIKKINFDISYIDENYLYDFKNIEELEFHNPSYDLNIDYTKFKKLKKIKFLDTRKYDLSIFITSEDLKYFDDNNIEIIFDKEIYKRALIEFNNELDDIVKELNITANDSKREKLDKITFYIINNLEYDKTFENVKILRSIYRDLKPFYEGGYLRQAIMEPDKSLCGSYAALFQALSNRLGINSKFIISNSHIWNLTNIDGIYSYTDTCWLYDEIGDFYKAKELIQLIDNNNKEIWYLKNINAINEKDNSHKALNIPNNLEINCIEDENDTDLSPKEYKRQEESSERLPYKLGIIIPSIQSILIYQTSKAIKKTKNKQKKLKK